MFCTHLENFLPFSSNLKLSSANSFSLKNLSFGKGLTVVTEFGKCRAEPTHAMDDSLRATSHEDLGHENKDRKLYFNSKVLLQGYFFN